jgi:hypothetical protein
MPGDPKECRKHAKRCWQLASEVTNPRLRESLTDIAQRWAGLATELAETERLLEGVNPFRQRKLDRAKVNASVERG